MHFALLDNNFTDQGTSWLFENPLAFIVCDTPAGVDGCFAQLEQAREKGYYVVGAMAYELGSVIDDAFASHIDKLDGPLMVFGVFASKQDLTQSETDAFLAMRALGDMPVLAKQDANINEQSYLDALARIKDYLENGESYQVNYTFQTRFQLGGSLARLYSDLRIAQPVQYGALIDFPQMKILSRSPELFFTKRGERLETHPMKGTTRRDLADPQNDARLAFELTQDPKQRAENLMIVDLLRNDLSRVSTPGTVVVDELFTVESFPTVHQMLSKISGQVSGDTTIREVLDALYPCGSITGAPKIWTSEIIKELEPAPRGFYTGAIGYVTPDNDMGFSVPIRTVVMDQQGGASMGIGSGVVYDSVGSAEFDECLLKGRFLFGLRKGYQIIESFYADGKGMRNLPRHLDRMEQAAHDLGFAFDRTIINAELSTLNVAEPTKLRIELNPDASCDISTVPIHKLTGDASIVMARQTTDKFDPIYRYKTSNRDIYNVEFNWAQEQGARDVIFTNQFGELTEGAIHNLFLRFGDEYFTPPIDAGLLNGIGRAKFIEEHRATEKTLTVGDLFRADEILLVSSTRGVVPVRLIDVPPVQIGS